MGNMMNEDEEIGMISFRQFMDVYPENREIAVAFSMSLAAFLKERNVRVGQKIESYLFAKLLLDESPVKHIKERFTEVAGIRKYVEHSDYIAKKLEEQDEDERDDLSSAYQERSDEEDAENARAKKSALSAGFNDAVCAEMAEFMYAEPLKISHTETAASHVDVLATMVRDAAEFSMLNEDYMSQEEADRLAEQFDMEKQPLSPQERHFRIVTEMSDCVAYMMSYMVCHGPGPQ